MEALNFLKFWKPTVQFPTPVIEIVDEARKESEEEEEESFFDLEITSSPKFDETREIITYPKPSLSLSPTVDPISKRKVLPLEPALKPHQSQSPIALLKSGSNFRAFSFKKSKSTERARESARRFNAMESPKSVRKEDSKPTSSRDVIQKYLKLVKPLYVKVKAKAKSSELFASSPLTSPTNFGASPKQRNVSSGIRDVCKHLGKSKSTTTATTSSFSSAQTTTSSSSGRRDDSLLQQHDGIQSAILHCKRSFNSSRDSCHLSRSTSDSSSMKSCSTDSYRISHSASETSHDNSARNSIEDGGRCC